MRPSFRRWRKTLQNTRKNDILILTHGLILGIVGGHYNTRKKLYPNNDPCVWDFMKTSRGK